MADQTLDPANQSRPDTKESYYIWSHHTDVPADSPEAKLPFHGPNQWPDEALAPGFKPAMQDYLSAMNGLAARQVLMHISFIDLSQLTLVLMSQALQLPEDFFQQKFSNPIHTLRPIHYTAEESKPDLGVLGAGAHTDWVYLPCPIC